MRSTWNRASSAPFIVWLGLLTLPELLGPAASSAAAQPFDGIVHDEEHAPIAGAHLTVNHAGRGTSDALGAFSIDTPRAPARDVVIATREGLLSLRLVLVGAAPVSGLTLQLPPYPADQEGFLPEGPATCGRCHRPYVDGWAPGASGTASSRHAQSALNPRVLDIWRGTASGRTDAASCAEGGGRWTAIRDASGARVERCYLGAGLLPDLNPQCGHTEQPPCDDRDAPAEARPDTLSDCAGCHTPGAAIRLPEELDLDVAEASPVTSSVTCAGCHRIAEVLDPDAPGVLVGTRLIRGDTPLGEPLALGPLDDAAGSEMAAGYAPVFATSLLCAPCHQDTYIAAGMHPRWAPAGVPSEQTYAEWTETPYATGERERHCQGCHMPTLADLGVTPTLPEIGELGPPRAPSEIHAHGFSPLTDAATRAGSLELTIDGTREAGELVVRAGVENRGVGHGWPSGVTSRNAVLVITVELDGAPLVESGGDALPLYAGSFDHGEVAAVSSSGAARSTVTLDHPVDASAVGRVLRLWTDTIEPHEHRSWSLLRTLPLAERGLFRTRALGSFVIAAVRGAEVELEGLAAAEASGAHWAIGDGSRLAGAAGLGFAKVNVAADGTLDVPFWRATDLVSDNRLAPDETQRSEHRFALPPGGHGTVEIRARLLYRAAFVDLAAQRGWADNETLALEATASVVIERPDAGVPDGGRADPAPAPSATCGCRAGARAPATLRWASLCGSLALLAITARRARPRRR